MTMPSISPFVDLSNLQHGVVSANNTEDTWANGLPVAASLRWECPFPGHRLGGLLWQPALTTALHPSAEVLVKWPKR